MVGSMFLAGAVCSGIMSAEGCRAVRVGSRLVAKANTFAPALLDSDAVCGRRGKKRVVWVGLIAVTVHRSFGLCCQRGLMMLWKG